MLRRAQQMWSGVDGNRVRYPVFVHPRRRPRIPPFLLKSVMDEDNVRVWAKSNADSWARYTVRLPNNISLG